MAIRQFKIPHTLVLVFLIIVSVGLLTWIIPAGEFDRADKSGRTVVIPDSYQHVEEQPQGVGAILGAPVRGFIDAANVIAFIFVVGGAFGIVNATGAITAAIESTARMIGQTPFSQAATIPILMVLFSLGGATFGMSEEVLAFIFIFVPFARALGYDSIVGAAIPFVGAGAGFAAAFLNPFTVGVAQGIAELPLFSGMAYRFLVWVVVTAIAIGFVMRYARKVSRNPELSPVFDAGRVDAVMPSSNLRAEGISRPQGFVIAVVLLSLAGLVVGALKFDWFIIEIAALFLAMGIISGLAGRLSASDIAHSFVAGAKEMMTAVLVVAFSRGILVVATDGRVIDTILAALSGMVEQAHPIVSAYLMLFVQVCINFFVPSGSGQAALTMPIMTPLSDLIGISRQTAVLVFQFGDGFTNLIIPTSGVTMGVLGIAKIPWEKWAQWVLPLEILFFTVALLFIAIPVLFGWGP